MRLKHIKDISSKRQDIQYEDPDDDDVDNPVILNVRDDSLIASSINPSHKATPNENIVSRPGFLHFTCGRAPITINHYYEYHYEHNEYN